MFLSTQDRFKYIFESFQTDENIFFAESLKIEDMPVTIRCRLVIHKMCINIYIV